MRSQTDELDDNHAAQIDMVPVKLPVQGSIIDMALLALLVFSASLTLPTMGPIRQLTALSILGLFAFRFSEIRPYLGKFWFILLFPAWVMMSVLWAPVPGRAMGHAIPFFVESVAILYFISFLSPSQIIRSIFMASQAVFLFYALPHIGTVESHVIPNGFSEKNWFANQMFVAMVSGLYVLFANESRIWERGYVIIAAPLAFILIVKAESATVLVLSLLSILFMFVMGVFWRFVARVQMLPALMILGIIAFALFGLTVALFVLDESPLDAFLGSLGKDTTLTGRTELWDYAQKLIGERPLLGLGAEGFWLPYRGDAQFLLEAFHKGINIRFSFHNSYLAIWVHLGIIGLLVQVSTVYYIIYRVVTNWFKKQDVTTAFFLLFSLIVLLRSFTESDLYNPLGVNKMILFLGGMTFVAHKIGYAPRAFVEAQLMKRRGASSGAAGRPSFDHSQGS